MKGTFKVSWRIALALALVLSLAAMTAPAAAYKPTEADPSISPVTAEFNIDLPPWLRSHVTTYVTEWSCAQNVTIDGLTIGVDYAVVDETITVFKNYLTAQLPGINSQIVLNVTFYGPCLDGGNYTKPFVITAVGHCPSISPEMFAYDLTTCQIRTPVIEIAMTMPGAAIAGLTAYVSAVNPEFEYRDLVEHVDYAVDGTTLIILESFLQEIEQNLLANPGDAVVIEISNYICLDHPINFTIMATGDTPSLLMPSLQYDLCEPPAFVATPINWGTASKNVTIEEANLNYEPVTLPVYGGNASTDGYKVATSVYIPPMGQHVDVLMVWIGYLAPLLQNPGDELVLEVEFDSANPVTGVNDTAELTITAVASTPPSLSPTSATINLMDGITPCTEALNVSTIITWCCCDDCYNVTKIVDRGLCANSTRYLELTRDLHYVLLDECMGMSKLVFTTNYTSTLNYTEIGDEIVLTIELCSQHRADCYLENDELTFTIKFTGMSAMIDPTEGVFNLDIIDPATNATLGNNVTVGVIYTPQATKIVEISDDFGPLLDEHYIVGTEADNITHAVNLTILSTYLVQVLEEPGDEVVLTIEFDQGDDATLTITAISRTAAAEDEKEPGAMCFIATAAYGTPMAEEIQILREFRDEYLLTNPLGRALVDLYYRVSPPIAQFIAEHPALQLAVRAMLVPALAMSTVAVNTSLATPITILSLVLAAIAVAAWASRRRERRAYA